MRNNCAIVIPIYRSRLLFNELLNLRASVPNIAEYDIYFVKPDTLNIDFIDKLGFSYKVLSLDPTYFDSVSSYNRLMLDVDFYNRFTDYQYMLILQLDAVILKPDLDYWLNQKYDYIGAPWKNPIQVPIRTPDQKSIILKLHVGNGGLSLRNVNSCKLLLADYSNLVKKWVSIGGNEDVFFSAFGSLSKKFKIPSVQVASRFSIETSTPFFYSMNSNQLPFGCHGWEKYDTSFWLGVDALN